MPLVINGVLFENPMGFEIQNLIRKHPELKERASSLCAMHAQVVGPNGLLYVNQREMASTVPHDGKLTFYTACARK